MEKILSKMQDLLDAQDLNSDSILNQYEEWDSLTRIALVSFAQKYYQINITLDELNTCKNIKDIYNLFNKPDGGGGITKIFCFINPTPLFESTQNFHHTPSSKVA